MVNQYPYQLWAKTTTDGSRDTDGNWVAQPLIWVNFSVCRDEANDGGKTVILSDGSTIVYSSLLFLPVSCPTIDVGTPIEVREGSVVRMSGTVSRFVRNQLHCRLWV